MHSHIRLWPFSRGSSAGSTNISANTKTKPQTNSVRTLSPSSAEMPSMPILAMTEVKPANSIESVA